MCDMKTYICGRSCRCFGAGFVDCDPRAVSRAHAHDFTRILSARPIRESLPRFYRQRIHRYGVTNNQTSSRKLRRRTSASGLVKTLENMAGWGGDKILPYISQKIPAGSCQLLPAFGNFRRSRNIYFWPFKDRATDLGRIRDVIKMEASETICCPVVQSLLIL